MNLLLVEDERKLSSLLKQLLEDERHSVDVALDGERAESLAETARYDAIILDLMIPKKDGFEVCRNLREKQVKTPVIMLTARTQIHDRVAGLDAGADDYLPKPFAFEELLARLRAITRREDRSNGSGTRLEVADLVLDLRTHQVTRGGVPIELTAREFTLLEFLMRNPNQVLTQSQIAERVWDYNFEGTTNRVAVYISYLRDKIDEGRTPKLIQTVYGVGYRLSG
jgi:DNA-binding response OmpR family regulator